ncbi:ANTAR domain-containing protein [Amycolatopsis thailandensis]|uniref:ANTAR domain-containing protein n=1 Tax=Amycolatopsis thailandensis TaxID=589330 RepID=UPI0036397494
MDNRDERLAATFVELADTLVSDFDLVELLDTLAIRCTELLGVSAAALLLAPPGIELRQVAASDSGYALSDLLAMAQHDGPAWQSHHEVKVIGPIDLDGARTQWPDFTEAAERVGYREMCAVPMRLRDQVLGALLLLNIHPAKLSATDVQLAQALADAATIGILHERVLRQQIDLVTQLHTALQSRILIEQAKGILAARTDTSVDQAFELMRGHARRHRRRTSDIARHVIDTRGTLPAPENS